MPEYADPVIDWLDAGRSLFAKRLYRDSCFLQSNGSYVKDLALVEKDLSRVCFMDNSPISYAWNKGESRFLAFRLASIMTSEFRKLRQKLACLSKGIKEHDGLRQKENLLTRPNSKRLAYRRMDVRPIRRSSTPESTGLGLFAIRQRRQADTWH